MSEQDLVARIRRKAKDHPAVFLILGDSTLAALTDADATTVLKLQAGVSARLFPTPGATIECSDGTDERMQVIETDPTNDQVTVVRGIDGTDPAAHAAGVQAVVDPRFTYADCVEEIGYIIEAQLWPYVWIAKQTTVPYQSTNEYFSPTATDIEQVSYVYQLNGGVEWRLYAEWIGKELADVTNFPNGTLIIPGTADASTIYVAYRARPTISNLTPALEFLVVDGALARMLADDVAAGAGGDRPAIEGMSPMQNRLQASVVRWQQFEIARARESAHMNAAEQARRSGR